MPSRDAESIVPGVELTVAGANFLGSAMPFVLLLLAIEAREAWSADRWVNIVQFLLALVGIGGAAAVMALCFALVNRDRGLSGDDAELIIGLALVVFLIVVGFLLGAMHVASDHPFRRDGAAHESSPTPAHRRRPLGRPRPRRTRPRRAGPAEGPRR